MSKQPWEEDAACRSADIDVFFHVATYKQALSYCASCPVVKDCRELAEQTEEGSQYIFGVFGGETPDMRKMRRKEIPPHTFIAISFRNQIVSGKIKPGQPIPSMKEIMSQYGQTHYRVRRAVRALREQGYIMFVASKGLIVRERQYWPEYKRAA